MKSSTPLVSNSGLLQAIATLIAIFATFAVNSLSNFFPPGGMNVGEISNTLFKDVQIIPANYAFIIWGIIYIGLIAYGVYQLQPAQRKDWSIRHVNRYLLTACVAQVIWIYLFTMRWFWPSVIAMVVILLALILSYESLGVGRINTTKRRQWLSHVPFSLYLAWISVATIVNVACALFNSGLQANGAIWTVAMLVVGTILGIIVARVRADITFVLVFIWAYGAIAQRQQSNTLILGTAILGAIAMVIQLLLSRRQLRQSRR